MEEDINTDSFSATDLDHNVTLSTIENCSEIRNSSNLAVSNSIDSELKHNQSAVWTTNATTILLKLYENKLAMLETPKKKTRIWIAISENLKDYNIAMSPDQVRWKINALAKKYKQCIENGIHEKFRYFNEMDNIYAQYNVDCDTYMIQNAEILHKRRIARKNSAISSNASSMKVNTESKAMIELRKMRLASRIDADRTQSKINLEKQWLDYLKRQEEQRKLRDAIFERSLVLREEELDLRRKELEMKESLELKKIEVKKREQEEMLQIEREKCELLKKILEQQVNDYSN